MKPSDQISEFVRGALAQGSTPEAIRAALTRAGWSAPEIAEALAGWSAEPGLPPVPHPRPYASAQEALLYGLLFLSLGVIAWHLCQLGMTLIDMLIPDLADRYSGGSSERWSIASLIVFTPLFLLLNRRIGRLARRDAGRRRSLVRKWFASLTLMVATVVFMADAIYLVYTFLNGDLTLRFMLKAALVAGVAALVLGYYRAEMDG